MIYKKNFKTLDSLYGPKLSQTKIMWSKKYHNLKITRLKINSSPQNGIHDQLLYKILYSCQVQEP